MKSESSSGTRSMEKLDTMEQNEMEDEKKTQEPDALVADSMSNLFGSMGDAIANPLKAAKPLTGIRIVGVILRDDDTPVANVSVGMMGQETVTDERGEFTLKVEKK